MSGAAFSRRAAQMGIAQAGEVWYAVITLTGKAVAAMLSVRRDFGPLVSPPPHG